MHHTEIPFATTAQAAVARDYLRACVEQNPLWKPEHTEEINALDHDTVIERTLQLWPQGWVDFLGYFAAEIVTAGEKEAAQWYLEAREAARGHLFASRLPHAALCWGRCSLTATEAVTSLGADIAESRREGISWREITGYLGVSVGVAVAWAIEGRARQAVAAVVRPFRAVAASE